MALKKILLVYSEEEHARLLEIKNPTGLNWEQFILEAAASYKILNDMEKDKDVE